MINILIADDHTIVRDGLKLYIQNLLPHANIDEACDGDSAFERIKQNDYALILLDVIMPDTDAFKLVTDILNLKPSSRILICTMSSEEVYAKKFLALGVWGYVNKESDTTEITKAITNVLNGKKYLSFLLTESLVESAIHNRPNENPFDLLTPRELQIARYLVNGEGVTNIGAALRLHSSTVGTYKARIFQKLQCSNMVEIHQLGNLYKIAENGRDK